MRTKPKNTSNYTILKNMLSKLRDSPLPESAQHLIIYAFVYKYCSDSLKDHFMLTFSKSGVSFDEGFDNLEYNSELRNDAYKLYGYCIENSDAFIDEVIKKKFNNESFLKEFFYAFSQNISFRKGSNDEKYMEYIFNRVSFDFDYQTTDMLKDLIFQISRLDIFDVKFPFRDVFDALASSDFLNVKSNPNYIYQILSACLMSQKPSLENVYDPFMADGTSFLSASDLYGLRSLKNYGKEKDEITYCYTIARLFMSYYDFDKLFVENEDACQSIELNNTSFDGIMSSIPIEIRNYPTSNRNLKMEIAKRNKRAQLEDMLSKNFDMNFDSLIQDSEINSALDKLINKMDVESDSRNQFMGEYEKLNDSEFLFMVNLIESLKDDGVMVVSISENFLFKESLMLLRKYMTLEKNYIDAVINIPSDFGRYKPPEVVIIFRKNKTEDNILFIDMSRDFDTKRSRLMVRKSLKSTNLLLSDETIDRMVRTLINREEVLKYSRLIDIAEVLDNGFNLSVSKYVDTFEGKFVNLDELKRQKIEIDKKQAELSERIDDMMWELDIRL